MTTCQAACWRASLRIAHHITSTSTVLQVGNASQTPDTPQGGEAPQEAADQHQLAAGEQGGDAGPVDGLEVGGPTSSSPSIGKPQK